MGRYWRGVAPAVGVALSGRRMKIITNVDDFGYSDDTVAATIECFEKGAPISATIMSKMPG
jgi:hypothetical protein